MSEQVATYLTGFMLVLISLLALLLVIPEASAASNRLKPGWRAWVWPLAFLGWLVKSSTEVVALSQNLNNTSLLWQIGDLAACFALTMLVLNSVYRALDDTGASRVTLIAWTIYFFFAPVIILLNFLPGLFIYEALCAVGLSVFYILLYLREGSRAADAPYVIAGVGFLLLSAVVQPISFELNLVFVVISQSFLAHLIQIVAIFFLYKGAANSYTVKYLAQRRRERNNPI